MGTSTARILTAVLAVIGSTLAAVPAAQAVPDPELTVTAVTLGRASVAVSGLNTVAVPVTVKAGYDSDQPWVEKALLNVVLKRTGGSGPVDLIVAGELKRTAGTARNGTWTGSLHVQSTANGTFQVDGVVGGTNYDGSDGSMVSPTPFAGPRIAITGVHQPKLGVSVIPRVVPFGSAYQVKAAVYDSATGKPYGTRILLQVVRSNLCVEYDAGSRYASTAGLLVTNFEGVYGDVNHCVRIRGRYVDVLKLPFTPLRPGLVAAVPRLTSAPVGTVVEVDGSVAGRTYRCRVELQRLYGSTQWRAVGSASVRASGRFTLKAQPAYVGNIHYRAFFPACHHYQQGVSRSFVIRGS
ncbi:hypothetical protein [Kribbella sp. CA-293567]|uniref:hypothetical protein n=1 Tax=Kribbella sp. CA-293567 TaxID=3002436 RepID=UPI0022DD26BE|nr:hypothetical protein [Kribbella sp. CA-293567]WBQ05398.1 hypothetical protein OX958_01040 [Kribbella sp. CA-293567]